jgi:hypothetical protein
MATEWILRVGDGENFMNSSDYRIWGIQAKTSPAGKYFVKNVKQGDRLWFVTSNSKGKIIAVGTYKSHNDRVLDGPLVNMTMTNEELGWSGEGPDWTSEIEVHYTHLYLLSDCNLLTNIKSPKTIRKYNSEKCSVNLPVEYENILRSWDDCF